jgi:hypothetical protein
MNKLAIIPLFFLSMCGTAPITDPPAHACSPRLDGKPTYCPDERDLILLPREEAKGEIDITSPYHLQSLQMMFQRNMRKGQIEKTATKPSDAINNALAEFNYGSNGSTESEELLQLPSNGDQ